MVPREILLVSIAAALLLNAVVSLCVAFSGYYSSRQKVVQIILVWAFPVLGGLMIGIFLAMQGPSPRVRTNTVGAEDLDNHAANLPDANSHHL